MNLCSPTPQPHVRWMLSDNWLMVGARTANNPTGGYIVKIGDWSCKLSSKLRELSLYPLPKLNFCHPPKLQRNLLDAKPIVRNGFQRQQTVKSPYRQPNDHTSSQKPGGPWPLKQLNSNILAMCQEWVFWPNKEQEGRNWQGKDITNDHQGKVSERVSWKRMAWMSVSSREKNDTKRNLARATT